MSQAQQMIRHSAIYAVGNVSRQLVGFIMLPIYTHYLTPADYGVIGLLVFLVSLFEILLGGHMFQAIPKFYHQENTLEKKNKVISTAFLVTSCFSGLACFIMAYFSDPISKITFGDEKYGIYVVLFSFLILTHALELYSLTYLRILKKPWTFFNFSMAKLGLQLSLNVITIVVMDLGLMGLAVSSLISSVIIAAILTLYTIRSTGFRIDQIIAKKIIKFSWPLWLSGLIGLYIGSSNKYFIRIFSSLDEVGLYELAAKFGFIVMVLVWSPFSQYWQTERFAIANTDDPYPSYSLAFRTIAALLFISGIGIVVFSGLAIEIMSAPEFHPATAAIPFLVVAGIFQSLTIFNNFSFMYTSRTLEITKNNIFTAAIISFLYLIIIPNFGFIGAALSLSLGSIAQYIYALVRANKIYPLNIGQNPLILGTTTIIIISIVNLAITENSLSAEFLLLKTMLCMLAFFAVLLIFFNKKEIREGYSVIFSRISSFPSKLNH